MHSRELQQNEAARKSLGGTLGGTGDIHRKATALLMMSDIPTPSLVIDMQALQRYIDGTTGIKSSPIPKSLALLNDGGVLEPLETSNDLVLDCTAAPLEYATHITMNPFVFSIQAWFDPESRQSRVGTIL